MPGIDRSRVDTANPRHLGIHSAVGSADDLPTYVERTFDYRLRAELAKDLSDRGNFVVMVGGSSTGKTRSLYEAILELVPDWWLFQPSGTAELHRLKDEPPRTTVFWLDELQQYLGGSPPLTSECVRALLRQGNLVVGTLWPDQYARWADSRDDVHLIRSAYVASVPDTLSDTELSKAEEIGAADSRIRDALTSREVGMTQVLAGGPRLVMCWDQPANPYAKAMIAAAADAHRLGVQAPLSEDLLVQAMYGYLPARQRVRPAEQWLREALPHTTEPLYGDVSALVPADGGRPGTLAGYTIADYLAQHVRRERRTETVPHEAWEALIRSLHRPDDLRRLAYSAIARLRYRYAEGALERLAYEFGDVRAGAELADLLIRQGEVDLADEMLGCLPPQDLLVRSKLEQI